jgi:hypothetical protein
MRATQLRLSINKASFFIKNSDLPSCVNCVYFISNKMYKPYNLLSDDSSYGKCKMFGVKDIVSGTVEHEYAMISRENANMCGSYGKYFVEKSKPN